MKKIHPVILSLLSGLLLFVAWPVSPLTFLVFVAFIPLLWIEGRGLSRWKFFGWTYLAMLCWNLGTTWWVCEASLVGGFLAIFINPLLMCVPWIGFYNIKKRMGERLGYFALVIFWLCFEYIHLNWQLSWPWLTLGNAFAVRPGWAQWYAYTGAAGGSLWIWVVNFVLFQLLQKKRSIVKTGFPDLVLPTLALLIPFGLSWLLSIHPQSRKVPMQNIVIVQPNIDPYAKYVTGNEELEIQQLIRLSQSQIDSRTALVIWPETAIPVAINEDSMRYANYLAPVWDFLKRNPRINLLTGIEGFRFLSAAHRTEYSQKIPGSNNYEDGYNSAVLMDSDHFQAYHKSKLVPGVETVPSYLHFLDALFAKFGGTTGSYARQDERTVLHTYNGTYQIAPAVCYESIYGEFMSAYIRGGANLIVIITNDGWWGNTPGYQQHENYARLRAIETGRWVARSANTGISCFIDPYGKVWDPQPWDRATAFKKDIPFEESETFYTRYGDLIYKAASVCTILLILWNLLAIIKTKKRVG